MMIESVLSAYISKTVECKIGGIADVLSGQMDNTPGYFQFEVEPGRVDTQVVMQILERKKGEVWPRIKLGIEFAVQLKKHPKQKDNALP